MNIDTSKAIRASSIAILGNRTQRFIDKLKSELSDYCRDISNGDYKIYHEVRYDGVHIICTYIDYDTRECISETLVRINIKVFNHMNTYVDIEYEE